MAKFITLSDETRLNIGQIASFKPLDKTTEVSLSNGDKFVIPIPVKDFEQLLKVSDDLPDRSTIRELIRHIDDLRNAIGRMPTSIRMHY